VEELRSASLASPTDGPVARILKDDERFVVLHTVAPVSTAVTAVTTWNQVGPFVVLAVVVEVVHRQDPSLSSHSPVQRLAAPVTWVWAVADGVVQDQSVFVDIASIVCQWMAVDDEQPVSRHLRSIHEVH
jgi:hypothetical protein